MSRDIRKRTFRHVPVAEIQISLLCRALWSKSSPGAFWIAKDANLPRANNEDSDADAQADLSLSLKPMSEGMSSYIAAQIRME